MSLLSRVFPCLRKDQPVPLPQIAVVRAATRVTDADVAKMTAVVNAQVNGPQGALFRWGGRPGSTPIVFYVNKALVPVGTPTITVYDDAGQAQYLGWHSEEGGVPFGVVYVAPVLDHGGAVLIGPNAGSGRDYTVASVLSHEVLELLADPAVQIWAQNYGEAGNVLYAWEVGDPVEADTYVIDVGNGAKASVSNYVTLAFFDAQNTQGPYDRLGLVKKPFSMTSGGYVMRWVVAEEPTSVFADQVEGEPGVTKVAEVKSRLEVVFDLEVPAWKRELKLEEAGRRSTRRSHELFVPSAA